MTNVSDSYANKFKADRETMLEKIRTTEDEKDALSLINEYRAVELEVGGYRKSLEILSDTTYQDRKHFLLELIQNADDAYFGDSSPSLKFVIFSDRIELHYNEEGFTLEDILSITDTGSSTKTGLKRKTYSFIGEKGIGFKSVFALAERIEIHSGKWHFELSKDKCIIPYPLYGDEEKVTNGTKIVIRFVQNEKYGDSISIIWSELQKYICEEVETFLFLQQLSSFVLEDRRSVDAKEYSLRITPTDRGADQLQMISSPLDRTNEYLLYKENIYFPTEIVKYRWEKIGHELGSIERLVTVALKMSNGKVRAGTGKLFCFLPTNVVLPMPIFLQADGHTKADRESLHDPTNNVWNRYLLEHLPGIIKNAIVNFTQNDEISSQVIDVVPSDEGTGQLAPVFNRLIQLLKNTSWIKTNDSSDWVCPSEAIIQSKFFGDLFNRCPEYRSSVEKMLGKKFVHSSWLSDPIHIHKLRKVYHLETLSEESESELFRCLGLPQAIFDDLQALQKVYSHISEYSCLKDRWNRRKREEMILDLCRAPIFPIEGEGFSVLKKNDTDDNIFWLSTASKRETGLGSQHADNNFFRIVDPSYTYTARESSNATESSKERVDRVNELNKTLQKLLELLGVREMKEETLFSDVQLPYLLMNDENTIPQKYHVLFALYKAYRLKKTIDKDYSTALRMIKDSLLFSDTMTPKRLNELLLPDFFEPSENEIAFAAVLSERLFIPDFIKQELSTMEHRHSFKQFLICCGIRIGVEIVLQKNHFSDVYDFKKAGAIFELWKNAVGNDYTSGRSIQTEQYYFDEMSQRLVLSERCDPYLISDNLYKAWIMQQESHIGKNPSRNIMPCEFGYIKVTYFRREEKIKQFKQHHFCGIPFGKVPLVDSKKTIAYADSAYRATVNQMGGFQVTQQLFSIAVEGKNTESQYDPKYLDILGVESIRMSHLNSKWDALGDNDYSLILMSALEMLNVGLENDGFLILDRVSGQLRPATDFRLGRGSINATPMIEGQYGELGVKIGSALGLLEELGIGEYIGAFGEYLSSEVGEKSNDKLCAILRNWKDWDIKRRNEIVNDYERAIAELNNGQPMLFLVNDEVRLRLFENTNLSILYLTSGVSEEYELEIAAKEIGFLTINEIGAIKTIGERRLNDSERVALGRLANEYFKSLGERDKSKILMQMHHYGPFENWGRQVRKVDSIKRVFEYLGDEIIIDTDLPLFDKGTGLFIVDLVCNETMTLAHMLSEHSSIPFKNAISDIKELDKAKRNVDVELNVQINPQNFSEISEKSLRDNRNNHAGVSDESWRMGIDPSMADNYSTQAKDNLAETFNSVSVKEIEAPPKRSKESVKSALRRSGLEISVETTIDGKEFLLDQYRGRCQICASKIDLHSGVPYIECYHIVESKETLPKLDAPFNLIAMCPNCFVKAKHGGGRDLTAIKEYSSLHSAGDIFPEEVDAYYGDYYQIPVRINGKSEVLTISAEHLSYFAALYEHQSECPITE